MEQYKLLAECLLPEHMLDWFELKNVQVEKQGDTQVVNLYLDENEQKPDDRGDLRPNGFTRESVFHDFPIRGHEVLLHLRRRRWLDVDGHNVMTECDSIQESTRCSTELAAFLKKRLETVPITARSFENDYHIDGDGFERAYKEHISGYREWDAWDHADEWLVFPNNIGANVSIDETCLSTGEVYTIVSNKEAHGRKGCLVAVVKGTKAKEVSEALEKIPIELRNSVEEVTLDFSESMHNIVEKCFPNAMRTLDRFHHQQFCLEALQEVRREHRREQMTRDANAREEHRLMMRELKENNGPYVDADGNPIRKNAKYCPERLENGETRAELLARSKGLLMMSPNKWTETQAERAGILFREFPDIHVAFSLTHSLRMIFSQRCDKEQGRSSLKSWYDKVTEFGNKAFNDIAAAMYDREDEILNFFVNRSTNAAAESLNAKIKHFRAQLRGIIDKKFFLFRLTRIFA